MADILNINPSDLSRDNLLQVRQRLAKRLNNRMRTLEKNGIKLGAVEKYNLLLLDYYNGRKRLPESKIQNDEISLQREVEEMQKILLMKSSSISGIKEIYGKSARTLEERYGISFSSLSQMQTFFDSQGWKLLSNMFGSKDAQRLVGSYDMQPEEIIKSVEESINRGERDILEKLGLKSKSEALRKIAEVERSRNSAEVLRNKRLYR